MATTSDTIPRDPSHYHPSTHVLQQVRDREIPKQYLGETIREGDVRVTHKPNARMFVKDYPGEAHPVAVTANIVTGKVITAVWRDRDS